MKHVTRSEFLSALNLKEPVEVFRSAQPGQLVHYHGWQVMRTRDGRSAYQYIIVQEGPSLDVPNGYTAAELSDKLGFPSSRLYGESKWHNNLQNIFGHVIERMGPHQKALRFRILDRMPARGKKREAPKPKPEPKEPVCVVCDGALTPRRTVRINGYEHCVPCNRRAFVDQCFETRKRLGI